MTNTLAPVDIPPLAHALDEDGHGRSVLIVDDDPWVLELLAHHLRRRRYEVTTCASGDEALLLMSERQFDAIISDLRMPGMDGVALLRRVKTLAPKMARVLLTGDADIDTAMEAVNEASVNGFLSKPCPPDTLARQLDSVLASAAEQLETETLATLSRQAALGTLAGRIGHEIGNLVAALDGSLSTLRDQVSHGIAPSEEELALINLLKERLAGHAKDLRTLAKPKAVTLEAVDLSAVVVDVVAIMQRTRALQMARIEQLLPTTSTFVTADRASLEATLMNLLKNAGEAIQSRINEEVSRGDMPTPGIITVAIATDLSRSRAELTVTDNGCGIPKDDLPHILQPFRTTKGENGTGLGLGIVRLILERHGGGIHVDSTEGEGSRFMVSLPIHPV